MTAPCQFPGCGKDRTHCRHDCYAPKYPHEPNIDCHPYNSAPTPTEPTSALGYLLGHVPLGESP